MSSLHIVPSELIIDAEAPVPIRVQDALVKHHIFPVNKIRLALGVPVWASANSGFRPEEYERERGRIPSQQGRTEWSTHTFKKTDRDPEGKGAVDWTTQADKMFKLGALLANMTEYTRIFFYPNELFYHCDYAFSDRGRRLFIAKDEVDRTPGEWYQIVAGHLL